MEPLERNLFSGNREFMGPLAQPPSAVLRDDDGVTPLADIFTVGGNRGRFTDENHVLTHPHRQLPWTLGMWRDDRSVIALAAAVHIEIAARAGGGPGFRGRAFRSALG